MKAGTRVLYVDSVGAEHPATVTDVGERGPSGSRVVSLELDSGGTKKDVPHAADGKGTRTYWIEAPAATGVTEGQRAAADYAAQPSPATRGAGYVYGEGEPVEPAPVPPPAETQDDGPGLGGGGGKDPGNPPPPPPPDPESTTGEDAGTASTRKR